MQNFVVSECIFTALKMSFIIPSSCFFSCSFVMSDLSFFNQSGFSNDDWLSSFLHTGFFSFSWYCYYWFIFFRSVRWLIFFFSRLFGSFVMIDLSFFNQSGFSNVMIDFLFSFILASSASVDIVMIDLSLFLWHFSSICLLWLVFFPSYWLLQLWLIYLCSLFKVRSWCALVQLGICTIIWLFKWHKHCGFKWCNFILMFDVA